MAVGITGDGRLGGSEQAQPRSALSPVGISNQLDVVRLRRDFPILGRQINGRPLIYLDSAATAQKPTVVLEAITSYYTQANANVHRGVHSLGNEATNAFEEGRTRVARFIDAPAEGIVFVRNTTEAINLVASSYAGQVLEPGDRIVLTEMEHHSNLVPWQLAAQRNGLQLEFIRVADDGTLDMDHATQLLQAPTKLLAVSHQSNVTGVINDLATLTQLAHANDVLVCVDAAQSVPHMAVSVRDLQCDFLAFSGHKMCGPMGIGVLWARPELLDAMPPFLGGGSMISRVDLQQSTWAEVPHKFEAGTPDVAGVAGLVAACDYLEAVGLDAIHAHEQRLTKYLIDTLKGIDGMTVYGPSVTSAHGGAVSFNVDSVHAHDVGTIADTFGVAIRAGHHCCQPLMRRFKAAATARASVYLYNDESDIDVLAEALHEVHRVFRA